MNECCLSKNISGYFGECCCNCKYLLEIHTCSCEHCSKVTGYICIAWHIIDNNYKCSYTESKHGLCELWQKRIEKSIEKNL